MSFARNDALLGNGGDRNVGALLTADSLGSAQIPAFAPMENAIRDASGTSAFRLNAGQLSTAANSRVVTAPLILEYGLTSRMTIGVVVPVVETRTSLATGLNYKPGAANVGVNGSAVIAANAALIQSMTAAAAALQTQLATCQTSPSTCGLTSAQQSAAQSLIQNTTTLSNALGALYGTGTTEGRALIPLDSSAIQSVIGARVQSIRDQYNSLLGADPITGTLTGAHGPAANAQLQGLLTALGHDTLQSIDRSSIGDITVGATYQFLNTYSDTTVGAAASTARHSLRVAGNVAYRFGTGEPANRNRFFDLGTGYGQPGITGGLAADAQLVGNLSASLVGSYTAQFGSVAVSRIPNLGNYAFPLDLPVAGTYTAGNVVSFSAIPRYRFSGNFGLTGRYTYLHVGGDQYSAPSAIVGAGNAAATAQQLGLGLTYGTIMSLSRGPGRIPFEVSYNHLETISGSGGPTPKTFVDQIELRVYFR
ncbi:MAG TPA: hypothetical protein VGM67_00855 [Gemmatimonadaceae bacterium]|jgi:hypothetical protein